MLFRSISCPACLVSQPQPMKQPIALQVRRNKNKRILSENVHDIQKKIKKNKKKIKK
jgi:hypothetical protein